MKKNPRLDEYFAELKSFKAELNLLREILNEFELDEEFKWWQPVYDFKGKNVIILGKFKTECVFSFVKGSLLTDKYNILLNPGPNAQSGKVLRFKNCDEIRAMTPMIKEYVLEAIDNERQGKKVIYQDYPLPDELIAHLEQNPHVKDAWNVLTKGRQKSIVLFISSAKKHETRIQRVEKCVELILAGKGMNDD